MVLRWVDTHNDVDYRPDVAAAVADARSDGDLVQLLSRAKVDRWDCCMAPTWATAQRLSGPGNLELAESFERVQAGIDEETGGPGGELDLPEGSVCVYWPVVPHPGDPVAAASAFLRACYDQQRPGSRPYAKSTVALRLS